MPFGHPDLDVGGRGKHPTWGQGMELGGMQEAVLGAENGS